MSEALAEVIDLNAARQAREVLYAHSHSALEAMAGELALKRTVEFGETAAQQAFADFASGAREMARTDPEFGQVLDLDDRRDHPVVNGRAMYNATTTMVAMVGNGRRVAESTARISPEFRAQHIRDGADVIIAEMADALRPGESLVVPSMPPVEELEAHPEIYRDRLGYRKDLMYWQWYAKTADNKLTAGSFSVGMADETAWRTLLASEGFDIPPGESLNTWILHGRKFQMDAEQTEAYVRELRQKYYRERGVTGERHSVSEYFAAHNEVVEKIFVSYYPSLAEAAKTGQNNETMRGLAGAMLQANLSKMKASVRQTLIKVANRNSFDGNMVDAMDAIIRYAVVEELRTGLPAFFDKSDHGQQRMAARKAQLLAAPTDSLNMHLAHSLQTGIQAGRSYGGCPGQVALSEAELLQRANSPQEAYGGHNRESDVGTISKGKCVIASCPNSERVVKVGGCGVCLDRCQVMYDLGMDPSKFKALHKRNGDSTPAEKAPAIHLDEKRRERAGRLVVAAETAA